MGNANMPSIVSCLCWIGKGIAKSLPYKIQLDKDELETLLQSSEANTNEDDEEDMEDVVRSKIELKKDEELNDDDIEQLYGLDKYDESDNDDEIEITGEKTTVGGLTGLMYYANNEDDPYITLKDEQDDEETEDFHIKPNDNLLLVGKAEDEFSTVEVHVFDDTDNHCYCHHEILINTYPLALEWLDYDPGQPEVKGNYVAVGSMSPTIEIWDVDLVDAPEPVCVLGMSPEMMMEMMKKEKKKLKKKTKKKKKHKRSFDDERCEEDEDFDEMAAAKASEEIESHFDAVMGLSWNKTVRSLLASASADNTTIIWDLSELKCLLTLPHPDKVQTLQWHPFEVSLLATGCYDGIVRLYNCEDGSLVKHWKLSGEIEKLLWNHFSPNLLLVSTEQNRVFCLDKSSDALQFTIHAHTEAITDVSLSSQVPGMLVTSSTDDTIKFWDIQEKSPTFLFSRTMHMGAVLCSKFCVDNPYILAVGGEKNGFHLINILNHTPLFEKCRQRGLVIPENTSDPSKGGEEGADEEEEMEIMEAGASSVASRPVSAKSAKSGVKKKKKKVHFAEESLSKPSHIQSEKSILKRKKEKKCQKKEKQKQI